MEDNENDDCCRDEEYEDRDEYDDCDGNYNGEECRDPDGYDEPDRDDGEDDDWTEDGDDGLIDGVGFADPGSNSALRAATKKNPRNRSCPTCRRKNVLTPLDVARGYQCNHCADADEGGFDGEW